MTITDVLISLPYLDVISKTVTSGVSGQSLVKLLITSFITASQ